MRKLLLSGMQKCVNWEDTKPLWCYQVSLLLYSNISGYFLTKLEISHSKKENYPFSGIIDFQAVKFLYIEKFQSP